MNKLTFLVVLLAFGLFATSCSKDGDSEDPVVTISSPANGASFTTAETLVLSATITDNELLRTIVLSSDLGLSETITTFDTETSHSINFNITFDANTPAGSYSLTITATDDEGNTGSEEVGITIQ